jgi:hypothetical protein
MRGWLSTTSRARREVVLHSSVIYCFSSNDSLVTTARGAAGAGVDFRRIMSVPGRNSLTRCVYSADML